jgi:hypothetical protein
MVALGGFDHSLEGSFNLPIRGPPATRARKSTSQLFFGERGASLCGPAWKLRALRRQALLETGEGPPMFAFGELAVWFRPKVVRLEYLMDAEDEEIVRRLRAKGHELHWVLETRLGEFQRDGWKPVTQWDKTGRRSIFMVVKSLFCCIGVPPRRIRYERSTSASRISRSNPHRSKAKTQLALPRSASGY